MVFLCQPRGLHRRLIALALLGGAWFVVRQQLQRTAAQNPLPSGATSAQIQSARLPDALEISVTNQRQVLEVLAQNDRQWQPRLVVRDDGRREYTYRLPKDVPELSLSKIQALLRSPPDYSKDAESITTLLTAFNRYGVTVVIAEPNVSGASGEWNPRRGELRISHSVVSKGTRSFRRVLNHEAIHVAQSCFGGSIRSRPRALGLSRGIDTQAMLHLNGPVYAGITSSHRLLEEEAYANQDELMLGALLLDVHCRS